MIDILRLRYPVILFSLSIMAAAGAMFLYRLQTRGHGFSYSVDFTGGTQVRLKFDQSITATEISSALAEEWPGAVLRKFGENDYLVRVKEFASDAQGLANRIVGALTKAYPTMHVQVLENESVGAGIGESLRSKSVYAVCIALIVLLFYIAARFWSIGFAVGSVVALAHDALIILAVFILLDKEVSVTLIAAILAILGYSINDTIVIYSQIRENLKSLKDRSAYDIINISLNQTMRRTILTSFSTALTVGAMLVLGGEALRDFSLALLVGIIFGTLSSIFIASPIVLFFDKNRKRAVA